MSKKLGISKRIMAFALSFLMVLTAVPGDMAYASEIESNGILENVVDESEQIGVESSEEVVVETTVEGVGDSQELTTAENESVVEFFTEEETEEVSLESVESEVASEVESEHIKEETAMTSAEDGIYSIKFVDRAGEEVTLPLEEIPANTSGYVDIKVNLVDYLEKTEAGYEAFNAYFYKDDVALTADNTRKIEAYLPLYDGNANLVVGKDAERDNAWYVTIDPNKSDDLQIEGFNFFIGFSIEDIDGTVSSQGIKLIDSMCYIRISDDSSNSYLMTLNGRSEYTLDLQKMSYTSVYYDSRIKEFSLESSNKDVIDFYKAEGSNWYELRLCDVNVGETVITASFKFDGKAYNYSNKVNVVNPKEITTISKSTGISPTSYKATNASLGYPLLVAFSVEEKDIASISSGLLTSCDLLVDGKKVELDPANIKQAYSPYSQPMPIQFNLGYFTQFDGIDIEANSTHDIELKVNAIGRGKTNYEYVFSEQVTFKENTEEKDFSVLVNENMRVSFGTANSYLGNSKFLLDPDKVEIDTSYSWKRLIGGVTTIAAVGQDNNKTYSSSELNNPYVYEECYVKQNYPDKIGDVNVDYEKLLDEADIKTLYKCSPSLYFKNDILEDVILDLVLLNGTEEVARYKNACKVIGKNSSTKVVTYAELARGVNNHGDYISFYVYGKNLTKSDIPKFYSDSDCTNVVAEMADDEECGMEQVPDKDVWEGTSSDGTPYDYNIYLYTLKKNTDEVANAYWLGDREYDSMLDIYIKYDQDVYYDCYKDNIKTRYYLNSYNYGKGIYAIEHMGDKARIYITDGLVTPGSSITIYAYDDNYNEKSEKKTVKSENGELYVEINSYAFKTWGNYWWNKFWFIKDGETYYFSAFNQYMEQGDYVGYDPVTGDYKYIPNQKTVMELDNNVSSIPGKSKCTWELHDRRHIVKTICNSQNATNEIINSIADGMVYTLCYKDSKGNVVDWQYVTFKPAKYTIVFEKNNAYATGSMTNQTFIATTKTKLKSNAFKCSGATFMGWSTTKDGEVEYANTAEINGDFGINSKTITLYAQWEYIDYAITYNICHEGASYLEEEYSTTYNIIDGAVLPTPVANGYIFKGWFTAETGGKQVTDLKGKTGDIILYAQWEKGVYIYTIKFDANGGTGSIADQKIPFDEDTPLTLNTVNGVSKIKREDCKFLGWSEEPDGEVKYEDGAVIVAESYGYTSREITLYAIWADNRVVNVDLSFSGDFIEKHSVIDAEKKTIYIDSAELIAECGSASKITFNVSASLKNSADEVVDTTDVIWTTTDKALVSVESNSSDTKMAVVSVFKNSDGVASITATAKDSLKKSEAYTIYVCDYTPVLDATSVTINSWASDNEASIKVYTAFGNELVTSTEGDANKVEIVNKDGSRLNNIEARIEDDRIVFSPVEAFAKNISLTNLTLKIPTSRGVYSITGISVLIKNSAPAVASSQKSKFNLFYKNSTVDMSVTAKDAVVKNVVIDVSKDEDGVETFAGSWDKENQILTIKYADMENPISKYSAADAKGVRRPDTKLVLKIEVEDYNPVYGTQARTVEKIVNLSTESKKPVIVQSRASTVFSGLYNNVPDAGGYNVAIKGAEDSSDLVVSLPTNVDKAISANGYLSLDGDKFTPQITVGEKNNRPVYTFGNTGASVIALNLSVVSEGWVEPIAVKHTFSISVAEPKMVLSKNTAIINTKFYTMDVIKVTPNPANITEDLLFVDDSNSADYWLKSLSVKPDAKAEADKLNVVLNREDNTINVSVKDGQTVKPGAYKFELVTRTKSDGKLKNVVIKNTAFTVKVVATVPALKLEKTAVTVNKQTLGVYGVSKATMKVDADNELYDMEYSIAPDAATEKAIKDGSLNVTINSATGEIIAKIMNASLNADAKKGKSYTYIVKANAKPKDTYGTYIPEAAITLAPVKLSVKVLDAAPALAVKSVSTMDIAKNRNQTYTVTAFANTVHSKEQIMAVDYVVEEYDYVYNPATRKYSYVMKSDENRLFESEPVKAEGTDKNGAPNGTVQLSVVPKNPGALDVKQNYYIRIVTKNTEAFSEFGFSPMATGYLKFKATQTNYSYTVTGNTTLYKKLDDQSGWVCLNVKNVAAIKDYCMVDSVALAKDKSGKDMIDVALAQALKGNDNVIFDFSMAQITEDGNGIRIPYTVKDSTKLVVGKKYNVTFAVTQNNKAINVNPVNVKVTFVVKK